MFRLEVNGVSFLHIGDNRADWPPEVARAVGDVDVLMVTVDDSIHLLTYDEVDGLIDRLQPRVVIPMHYAIPGITSAGNASCCRPSVAGTPVRRAPPRIAPRRLFPGTPAQQHRGLAVPARARFAVRAGNIPASLKFV